MSRDQAERIKGTPVPLSYSRHTSRFFSADTFTSPHLSPPLPPSPHRSRFFSIYTFTLPLALCEHIDLWLLPPTVGSRLVGPSLTGRWGWPTA